MMQIGYACQIVGYKEYTMKTCRLASVTVEKMNSLIQENLQTLLLMLKYNQKNNIKVFRISSDIIPLASHPNNPCLDLWKTDFRETLNNIGKYIIKHDMRVSMHPGQYTIVNALDPKIVERATMDLDYHASFLDLLGLPISHKMVLHIGGAYGDKEVALKRFIKNAKRLPIHILNRLILENDDRIFNIDDVLEACHALSVPAVFDTLHHTCNPTPKSIEECLSLAAQTWKVQDGRQKIHYSQQKEDGKIGSHSSTININQWLLDVKMFGAIDVMLEVKDKNMSAIKCNCISNGFSTIQLEDIWKNYRYLIMRHSQKHYDLLCDAFQKSVDPLFFFTTIDEALQIPETKETIIYTAQHIFHYIENSESSSSFEKLIEKYLLDQRSAEAVFSYLYRLINKHQLYDILDSYTFY